MYFDLYLNQLIDQPTHIQGNIPDLVLTNAEHLLHYLSVDHLKLLPIQSDNYPLTFTLPEPK